MYKLAQPLSRTMLIHHGALMGISLLNAQVHWMDQTPGTPKADRCSQQFSMPSYVWSRASSASRPRSDCKPPPSLFTSTTHFRYLPRLTSFCWLKQRILTPRLFPLHISMHILENWRLIHRSWLIQSINWVTGHYTYYRLLVSLQVSDESTTKTAF